MTKKVIWADDNQIYRDSMFDSLRYLCSREGIDAEFEGVSDGSELIEKVRNGQYDIVFTDNQMLSVHGLQAIRQIREFNQSVPIYMASSSEIGAKAQELGATGYLDKNNYDAFKDGLEKAVRTHLK